MEGIYILHLLQENSKKKLFEQLYPNIIFCYLVYFMISMVDIMKKENIPFELDVKNLIAYKDTNSIKFIYLIKFQNFGKYFKKVFLKS